MTKIKLCGLTRECDIDEANRLKPDYIGFVFAEESRRYITPEKAAGLKKKLCPNIWTVGVFVNEEIKTIIKLLEQDVIDFAQLHGTEDDKYIRCIKEESGKPVIKAFRVMSDDEIRSAEQCAADHILLDSGAGSGKMLDWSLIKKMQRPFFLAGGLSPFNVREAILRTRPFAVDVSSGIETDGWKDPEKMKAFVRTVRGIETERK